MWKETGRKIEYTAHRMSNWAFIHAYSAYTGRPGKYVGSDTKSINQFGFISTPEITLNKPQNTIRIVFLGGSSTAGTGKTLADKDTWPWQVIEHVRENYSQKNIEFINGALGGYSSFESYGRLWSQIRFFEPDIIVMMHGWNDLYYFNNADSILKWRTNPDHSWGIPKIKIEPDYKPSWIDPVIRPFQSLIRLRLLLSKKITDSEGKESTKKELLTTYDERCEEIWRTQLKLFKTTSDLLNAKLFVIKQATLIAPNLPMQERVRCRYDFHGFDHDAHVKAFKQIYQIIDEEIPANYIIDTTPLSGIPEYFHDHIHFSEEGASKMAEIISPVIESYLNNNE